MSDSRNTASPKSSALGEEDVMELLPWYVTGKTSPEENAQIERHLSASPKLQAELAMARRERQVSLDGMQAIGEPSPDFLNKVLGQLDGARQWGPIAKDKHDAEAPGLFARLFGFASTPALRLVAIAACLAIVVEGAAIVKLAGNSSSGTYETASAPDMSAAGPHLIVQFQPNAGMAAIGSVLSELDAGIIRGPMPDGSYVIGLKPGADVDHAIAALKGHADLVTGVDRGS
ncbi:MAG TPA: zf-HC2 domain-containing protein [Dongiaceae bacterium]|jgi:anti-sigma factor RsiW|nr:zf-HC2 domain-containing protein [Dongiaceae bacterium]